MPWSTPSLRTVREMVRNDITASLSGAVLIANSVLRVMSDAMAALAHLVLRYIDWLALQLLPDTAETEWLDRHGNIWLVNSDGSHGRKSSSFAYGTAFMTGLDGSVVPAGTILDALGIEYEVLDEVTIGTGATTAAIRALTPGSIGNADPGTTLSFSTPIAGVDTSATVDLVHGGADVETDDQLRSRILFRIRQPPMGGDKSDYEAWALAVPGVTRAWASPQELGIGTMTVRFMMDDLRQTNDGFPSEDDVAMVQAYIDTKRPVTVKDFFVEAPLKYPIDVTVANLIPNTAAVQAEIEASVREMLFNMATPGQTIFAAWKSYAVMNAAGVESFDLVNTADDVMPSPGYMGVMGTLYAP